MDTTTTLDIQLFGNGSDDAGFYVNRLSSHLRTSHAHINRPHKHDFYVFVLFTVGHGTHDIDFTHYEVKAGSLFLMSPGQTHSWELSADAEGFVFFHTAAFYALQYGNMPVRDFPFFASLSYPPYVMAAGEALVEFISLCERMYSEYINAYAFRGRLIASLMTAAYIDAARLIAASGPEKGIASPLYQSQFEAFENLVELHFRTIKSAAEYADVLHITPKHLNRICRIAAGKMTTAVIMDRVMLEAKRMLAWSHGPLTDIALSLGYEDYAYFSKLFRKKTGKTPSEFMKKMGHPE